MSIQVDILRDIIKRIIVKSEVIILEFYIGKPVVLKLEGDESKKNELPTGSSRSVARPDFSLVDHRWEKATFLLHADICLVSLLFLSFQTF